MKEETDHMLSRRVTGMVSRWKCVLVCLMLGALLATGCKKTPYIETVRQTPYFGLPQDVDQVFYVDMRRVIERQVVRDYLTQVDQDPKQKVQWDTYVQGMGFDPMNDFDSICVGIRAGGGPAAQANPLTNAVFIAMGRFENPEAKLAKLHDLLATQALIAPPPFRSGSTSTGYKTFSMEAPSQYDENLKISLNFGFPGKDVMV
ncbi:MAG: hypothetical protein LUQ59_12270, partial [Methanothrix sp.]|nr:hypothetical protein [Methanothrix sp.]